MIISHKHQFIYFKTRKTAGTSIEMALRSICGDKDVITPISTKDEVKCKKLGIRGPQNFYIPLNRYTNFDLLRLIRHQKRAAFENHMTCCEVMKYIETEKWKRYFKFTVDRNPYDKVVSLYYWRNGFEKYGNVSDFIKKGGLKWVCSYDLYSNNGIVVVDKVYKYENLNFFLQDISERLKLKKQLELPPYKAKSSSRKVKDYTKVLDKEAIELVNTIFAREFCYLKYEQMN